MSFRLYRAASGGAPLWEEQWTGANSVQVSDGLFNVMLGSLNPIPQTVITENSNLFLGITVGTDSEMSPRVQLGSVPFATQALTVPDGSIIKAKLAADVNVEPPDGSITTAKLADAAVTDAKLAANLVQAYKVEPTQVSWVLPSCGTAFTNFSEYHGVPGLKLDVNLTKTKTLVADISGIGTTSDAGKAIYSFIFVDNMPIKAGSDGVLLGGCRNDGNAGGGWCALSNSSIAVLTPGNHSVEARVWCDGSFARVYGVSLRALLLP